jgi:hypothetical protein
MILLLVGYPWSTYYRYFSYGWGITVVSYLIVAVFIGLVAGAIELLLRNLMHPGLASDVLCGAILFILIVITSILFGPYGLDVPGTRVRGIFFSEWNFLSFIVFVGGLVSLAELFICRWLRRLF